MFYNYDARNDELKRISRIPYDQIKQKALKNFIEKGYLNYLKIC